MSSDGSPLPPSNAPAPRPQRRKSRNNSEFWRPCRFLYPYRAMVATSIVCALFIGIAFTGGLSSMVPMMQVFLKGDTIQSWAHRSITERRLGVKLVDEPGVVRIQKLDEKGAAAAAELKPGDLIEPAVARPA